MTPSVRHLALALGALVAIGPFAIDTYLPALPSMASDFGVKISAIERSVSLYLIGAAIGQLFSGPLSDRIGRKPVAVVGLLLFCATSLAIAAVRDVIWLDVLRVIQAIGGGVTVITSGATVRDHFQGREAAKMMTAIGLVMLIAPLIAPAAGTALMHAGGWQTIFHALALYSLFLLGVVLFALPPEKRRTAPEHASLVTRWWRVLRHAPGPLLILCNGFSFSVMFAFITDSAFLYLEFYDVGEHLFPLLFGANVVAMLVMNRVNMLLLRRVEPHQIMWGGLCALVVTVLATGLLFHFASQPPLWLVVPALMAIGGMVALIMPNGIATLLHQFPRDSGSATGLNGSGQFLLAGGMGTLLSLLHDGTPMPMVAMMLVCAVAALVCRWLASRSHDLTLVAPGQE